MNPPLPKPGESQPAYAVRFHAQMQQAIPRTSQRNRLMLSLWKQHGQQNPLIAEAVAERFGANKRYRMVENVAEFTEHSTKHRGRDGQEKPIHYDRNALIAVANRCNERIADTGDFSPISDGHTPTDEGGKMPDVLGYAGPFYLGQIGNTNPRWAIFADEWHDQTEAARLDKLRRRSPEVWMEERMEDRFLDPVAALGAETPRLDMGWSGYSRDRDGRQVMKYSGPATAPGQFNTSPTGGSKSKQRYAPENAMDPQQGGNALVEQVANQVMQLIMSSDVWTALQEAVQDSPQPSFEDEPAAEPDGAEDFGDEPAAEGTPPVNDQPEPPPAAAPEPFTDEGDGPELDDEPEPEDGAGDDDFSADDFDFSPADEGGEEPEADAGADFGEEPSPEAEGDDFDADDFGGDDDPDMGDIGGAGDDEITVDLDDDDKEQMARYMAGECSEEEMKAYRAEKKWRRKPNKHKARYMGEEQSPMTQQYTRSTDPATGKERYQKEIREQKAKYTKLERELKANQKETAELRKEVAEQRRNRTNAERYSRLMELARNKAVDADDEYEQCNVQAMPSDDAFEKHVATIERYADDIPVDSPRLHTRDDDGGRQNAQQQAAEKAKYAKAVTQYALDNGLSWDQAKTRYAKEHAS